MSLFCFNIAQNPIIFHFTDFFHPRKTEITAIGKQKLLCTHYLFFAGKIIFNFSFRSLPPTNLEQAERKRKWFFVCANYSRNNTKKSNVAHQRQREYEMLNKGKKKNITNFPSPCHRPHTEQTRARASEDLLKQIYYVRHQAFSALKHFHVVLVASLDERLFIEFFFPPPHSHLISARCRCRRQLVMGAKKQHFSPQRSWFCRRRRFLPFPPERNFFFIAILHHRVSLFSFLCLSVS